MMETTSCQSDGSQKNHQPRKAQQQLADHRHPAGDIFGDRHSHQAINTAHQEQDGQKCIIFDEDVTLATER